VSRQLLRGATVVTVNAAREVIPNGGIVIEGNRIAAVGAADALLAACPDAESVDCSGGVLVPGFVNTHTHLFQTLLKGLGDDRVLKDWFTCMTGPSAAVLAPEDCYVAALHGCAEALLTGTTMLVDFMYVHPVAGLGDAVYAAMTDSGIRGVMARGFITAGADIGVPEVLVESADSALTDAQRLISQHNHGGALVHIGLAPSMIWTVDEESLQATRSVADVSGALITMHVAETAFEIENSLERYGLRDTALLERTGLLGPDLLAVHCVHCDADDLAALARHQVKISHNPCSNLYLASGVAPIPEMEQRGLTIGLASDGPASSNNHSLLQAMKFAALTQKGVRKNAEIITAERVLEMATIEGARAVGLESEIGSIEPGKKADLVLLDYGNLCVTPLNHPVSALVYSARGDEVDSVWVDGRRVVENGRLLAHDEHDIIFASQQAADRIVDRAGTGWLRQRPWRSRISTTDHDATSTGVHAAP
jgi:5-methylthioadenosine/S-adenosylhomocysteine deaminase